MKKNIKATILLLTVLCISLVLPGCAKGKPEPFEKEYNGLYYQKYNVEDIPAVNIFINDGQKKPTVFIIHGYGGSKNDSVSLGEHYAKNGYFAVIFDAYGHGERVGGPVKAFPEVMAQYPYDIEKVVSNLKTNPQADLNRLGMLGISMGACAIYKYCTMDAVKPKAVTPFIGTPYYEQLMNSELSRIAYDRAKGRTISSLPQEKLNGILTESSPYKDWQKLKGIAILMQNGGIDTMIEPVGVKRLERDLKSIGANNAELIIYPELWHEISPKGWDKAFEFMEKHLK